MNLLNAATELQRLARKAELPYEKYVNALATYDEYEKAQRDERRAHPAEKDAITRAVSELNGELSPDQSVSDVLHRAGVRTAQGTRSFAKREVKRVLELAKPANGRASNKS